MRSKIIRLVKHYEDTIGTCDKIIEKINEQKRIARAAGDRDELHDLLNDGKVVSAQRQCYSQVKVDLEILVSEMEDV